MVRTVDGRWDATLDVFARMIQLSKSREDLARHIRTIDDLNAQFKSAFSAIRDNIDRIEGVMDRDDWEDELDALNTAVDRLQTLADELEFVVPGLADEFERTLEGVEDGLEALDDLADEWDQRLGDDNDDFDDWDDEDIA